ncbi:MAG: hypothetical protein ACK5RP_05665 [Betaproteobacteria bacterium]
MSADPNRLRLEALRLRAAIEREDLSVALSEVHERTAALRRLAGAAQRLGSGLGGRRGAGRWLAKVAGALDQRPWVPLLVAGTLRLARRSPWAVVVALGALGAVLLAARARSNAAPDSHDELPPDSG